VGFRMFEIKSPLSLPRISALLSLLVVLALLSMAMTTYKIAQEIDSEARRAEESALDNALEFIKDKLKIRNDIDFDDQIYNSVVNKRDINEIRKQTYRRIDGQSDSLFSFLIDGDDRIYYSSINQGAVEDDKAIGLTAPIRPMIDRLRERARSMIVDSGDDSTSRYVADARQALHAEGLIAADIAKFDSGPALVTAAVILPKDAGLLQGRKFTVIAHVRPFNASVYAVIAEAANIKSIGPASDLPGRANHALRNMAGQPVVTVSRTVSPPGARIIGAAKPIFFGSFALFLVTAAVSALILQRLIQKLTDGERAALFSARHDGATGLANRAWFRENLIARSIDGRASGKQFALALIDLDYFKAINDSMGHAAGDAVLLEVAKRLIGQQNKISFCGRLGGDEFVALSPDLSDEQFQEWGRSLRLALMHPVTFEGKAIQVSTSIGIAISCAASDTDLMKQADMALYRAKREGRGCERLYDPIEDCEMVAANINIDVLRERAGILRVTRCEDTANAA
jgi:diguanylate cyclase (GGDEF)-like protein